MADYKFLHSKDIGYLLDGRIRISSLSRYRTLKSEQWIADRLEGSVAVVIPHFDSTCYRPEILTPLGFTPFVGRSSGRVTFDDVEFSYSHADVFVFCASRGELSSLSEIMCRDNEGTENPYDACVRIVDIRRLAHRMFHRGIVVELDGAKVSRLFTEFHCAPVEYINLSRTVEMGRPPRPSPFLKHDAFAQQGEVRIEFRPREAILSESLTIKIPRIGGIFVEEFRNRRE